jgi:hypothetical protein
MLHSQLGTPSLPKPMTGSNVIFFWDGMKQDVHNFVVEFDVHQRNKGETVKSSGTLQPLSIPPTIWRDVSMDFIKELPKSGNK